ncbi:DUF2169 family type VI secretion system accessory protein [Bradyrhizobium sp. UFLA05-112]
MPILIKPRTLGLLTKCERRARGASLIISVYAMFDLANPSADRLEGEQELWVMGSKELPPGSPLDIGMPKPQAEVLIGGHAAAPKGRPTQRMMLGWSLGPMQKRLLVTGDRYWQMTTSGWRPTAAKPFQQMPLTRQRAFGGVGHPSNPTGIGHDAFGRSMAGELVALPNVEDPEHAVQFIETAAEPAAFGPMMCIRDRPYGLQNFSSEQPLIQGHLPAFRVRCFIGWSDPARAVSELQTRIDTLWLFAGARRGIMIYRAAIAVQENDGSDVADIMLAYERKSDPARSTDHYLNVRRLRLDPRTAARYAFAEHQLKPELSSAERERRAAQREELAEQRAAQQQASRRWALDQELARVDLPPVLRPTIETPSIEPSSIPELLPEELESGEIDLAEILDAVETVYDKASSDIDKLAAQCEPVRGAYERLSSGNAASTDIDALLAAIGSMDAAHAMDTSFEQIPSLAALPAEIDLPLLHELDITLAGATDWRGEIVGAVAPSVDEHKQLELAHARFFGLPAGRPLESMRTALSDDAFSPPDIPSLALPEEAHVRSEPPPRPTIDEIAAQIENRGLPAETVQPLFTAFADAEAALSNALPALASDGRAPFEALIGTDQPPLADTPDAALDMAIVETKEAVRDLRTEIDKGEGQLTTAMAAVRLASPKPLEPQSVLAPAVARALGDVVEEEFSRGRSLAGRDLAGADLSGRQFVKADFSGAFLERTKLNGTNLAGATLMKATLAGAVLVNADLSCTDLTDANLGEADCRGTRFASGRLVRTNVLGARMVGASFDQAHLTNLQLLQVPMIGATFRSAQLQQCGFIQAALDNSVWQGAVLQRTQFVDLSLSGAAFSNARLEQTCFLKVAARQLDFSASELDQVSFIGEIDLRDARFDRSSADTLSFQDADIAGADFSMARLNGVYFGKSALLRATFRMTSLKGAVFTGNDLRGCDFYAANLLEAHLNEADLAGASLRHANLYGADLMDSTLVAADLSNANIDRTVLIVPRHVN